MQKAALEKAQKQGVDALATEAAKQAKATPEKAKEIAAYVAALRHQDSVLTSAQKSALEKAEKQGGNALATEAANQAKETPEKAAAIAAYAATLNTEAVVAIATAVTAVAPKAAVAIAAAVTTVVPNAAPEIVVAVIAAAPLQKAEIVVAVTQVLQHTPSGSSALIAKVDAAVAVAPTIKPETPVVVTPPPFEPLANKDLATAVSTN